MNTPTLFGDDGPSSKRVIRGTLVRWTEAKGWLDRDGLPVPEVMLVIGQFVALRRWQNKKPSYKTEHPLPDPELLNSTIPIAEWEIGLDGKPAKPWAYLYGFYLLDCSAAGTLYTFAHDSAGTKVCFLNLEEQIVITRMMRGANVYPRVHLEKRPFKTNYGWTTRPHLQILDWRALGGGAPVVSSTPPLLGPTTEAAVLPAAEPTAAPMTAPPAPPSTPASAATILDHTQPVKPVTVAELVADELPPWA
jgi:hypothetical protein